MVLLFGRPREGARSFCCLGGGGEACLCCFNVWAGAGGMGCVVFLFLQFGRGGEGVVSMILLFGRRRGFFLLFGRGGGCFCCLGGRRFLVFAVRPGNGSSLIYRHAWLGVDGL